MGRAYDWKDLAMFERSLEVFARQLPIYGRCREETW